MRGETATWQFICGVEQRALSAEHHRCTKVFRFAKRLAQEVTSIVLTVRLPIMDTSYTVIGGAVGKQKTHGQLSSHRRVGKPKNITVSKSWRAAMPTSHKAIVYSTDGLSTARTCATSD